MLQPRAPPHHFHWRFTGDVGGFSLLSSRAPPVQTGLTHLPSPLCRTTRRVENGTPRYFWLPWASWPYRSPGYSRGEGTTRTPWILRLFSVCWHSLQWTRIHRYTQYCLGPAWYYNRLRTKCMQTNDICNSVHYLSL